MKTLTNRKQESGHGRHLVVWGLILGLVAAVMLTGVSRIWAQDDDFDYSSETLRVGVWIPDLDEGEVLERGQEMSVGFQTNEDAYAVVYRVNTEGLVTVLWPRSRMDDGFAFGGHEYQLPVSGSRRLVASSRTGEGFIEAVVSRYPFDLRELELDFHHEFTADRYDFVVEGDPFLALNEINYAITGLKDTKDYVVTNYLSYYVHQKVDHPRYLCAQCHDDQDVAVHPYRDQCTIQISYDYGWDNSWYRDFGFYPVYYNPVYVYYDPWTWRPWVNFWYEPYYVCTYGPGYRWQNPAYAWCDSPYYRAGGPRYKTGRGLYQRPETGRRHKTGDYSRVTGRVAKAGPTRKEREVMRQKQGRSILAEGARPQGERPMIRPRPGIKSRSRGEAPGGLQIRRPDVRQGRAADRGTTIRAQGRRSEQIRNEALPGGSNVRRPGRVVPVNRAGQEPDRSSSTVRGTSRPRSDRGQTVNPSPTPRGDGRIKPVEPRKKGTRIWNSRGSNPGGDRGVRNSNPRRNNRQSSPERKQSDRSLRSRNSKQERKTPATPRETRVRSSNKSKSDSKARSSQSAPKVQSKSGRSSGVRQSSSHSSGGSRRGSSPRGRRK